MAEGEGPVTDEPKQRYVLRHVWREKLARERAERRPAAWPFALIVGGAIFLGTFVLGTLGQVLIRHRFEAGYSLACAAVAGLVAAALATVDRRARHQRRPAP